VARKNHLLGMKGEISRESLNRLNKLPILGGVP
jgi:hypothetical protein